MGGNLLGMLMSRLDLGAWFNGRGIPRKKGRGKGKGGIRKCWRLLESMGICVKNTLRGEIKGEEEKISTWEFGRFVLEDVVIRTSVQAIRARSRTFSQLSGGRFSSSVPESPAAILESFSVAPESSPPTATAHASFFIISVHDVLIASAHTFHFTTPTFGESIAAKIREMTARTNFARGLKQRLRQLKIKNVVSKRPNSQKKIEKLIKRNEKLKAQITALQIQTKKQKNIRNALNTKIECWKTYAIFVDRFLQKVHGHFASLYDVINFFYDDEDIFKCFNAIRNIIIQYNVVVQKELQTTKKLQRVVRDRWPTKLSLWSYFMTLRLY